VKRRFVVDLNVVRFAQTLSDEKGRKTLDSLRFLTELVARCHSLITCSELERRYSRIADELKSPRLPQGPSVFSLVNTASSVSEKWLHVSQPPVLKGDEGIPEDDRVLVRLAVANRANLVTADTRLARAIDETGILHRRGRQVLTVQQALEQVMAD